MNANEYDGKYNVTDDGEMLRTYWEWRFIQ